MGEVVDINSKKPHCNGRIICLGCKHEWQAVWPTSDVLPEFECSSCGMFKGVPLGLFLPAGKFFACNCGCFHFCIDDDQSAVCAYCGVVQDLNL